MGTIQRTRLEVITGGVAGDEAGEEPWSAGEVGVVASARSPEDATGSVPNPSGQPPVSRVRCANSTPTVSADNVRQRGAEEVPVGDLT